MTNKDFTPLPNLKTKRLVLRSLIDDDKNAIFKLRSDYNVNKYLERQPCKSVDDAMTFIKNIQENQSVYWGITLNADSNLIGTICLFDFSEDNTKAEIGYELLPDFQGKGIMHEAMVKVIDYAINDLRLTTILAFTHPENLSSSKLLEKANFKKQNENVDSLVKYELGAQS